MPQFIYFDRYDALDSAVHIPTFMTQLRDDQHAPRVRTTRALFRHVNLDPQQLHELNGDDTQISEDMRRRVDERAILTSSAGQAMTDKFSGRGGSSDATPSATTSTATSSGSGSDDLDPSEIELDQRS